MQTNQSIRTEINSIEFASPNVKLDGCPKILLDCAFKIVPETSLPILTQEDASKDVMARYQSGQITAQTSVSKPVLYCQIFLLTMLLTNAF
jgi:hypothetical protein